MSRPVSGRWLAFAKIFCYDEETAFTCPPILNTSSGSLLTPKTRESCCWTLMSPNADSGFGASSFLFKHKLEYWQPDRRVKTGDQTLLKRLHEADTLPTGWTDLVTWWGHRRGQMFLHLWPQRRIRVTPTLLETFSKLKLYICVCVWLMLVKYVTARG